MALPLHNFCTADDEVSEVVKSLPTRESLKGFKMFPLDFEKVRIIWQSYA